MATKNFFVHDGLKVRGDTLLNGSTYTAAPSAKLHIKTAANGAGANLSNVNGLIIENGGSSNTNYALKLATGAGNIFSVTNAGRVGIGTITPNEELTVVGDISASGSIYGNIEDLEFTDLTVSGDLTVGGTTYTSGLSTQTLTATTEIESPEFIGNLRGAVSFTAKAGEALTKGDAVYISGISGNTTVVGKADADDSSKMPAFGIANESVSLNASVTIINFGALTNFNTSSFPEGTELFVGTTAGQLVSAAPTGESAAIQKIAKVTRQDATVGSITIMGAGRSNAVPNLNEGRLFVGNSSNQAVADGTIHVDIANSRVGIGVTNPDFPLEVAGAIGIDDYIYHNGDHNTYLQFNSDAILLRTGGQDRLKISNTETVINDDTLGHDFRVEGDIDTALFFTDASTDRVGIGTITPQAKFEVTATSHVSSVPTMQIYHRDYPATGDVNVPALNVNVGIANSELYRHGYVALENHFTGGSYDSPNLFFKTNKNSSNHREWWGVQAKANSRLSFSYSSDDTGTGAASASPNEVMSFSTNGNVGIGTSSPRGALEVYEYSDSTLRTSRYTSNGIKLRAADANDSRIRLAFDAYLYDFTDGQGNTNLYIAPGGQVGIGTTNPVQKLFVQPAAGVNFGISNSGSSLRINAVNDAGTANIPMEFTGSCFKLISGDALVCQNLTVNGYINMCGGSSSRMCFNSLRWAEGSTSGSGQLTLAEDYALAQFRSDLCVCTDLSVAGDALICTDLTVNGNLTVQGTTTTLNTEVCTTSAMEITNAGTGPALVVNQTGCQPVIDFQDDGTSTFYIEDGGNVGIGTTDPGANLHVYGSGQQSMFIGSSDGARALLELDGAGNGDGAGGDYAYLAHNADGTFDIKNLQNNSIRLATGSSGTTRMTITSAGRVGIGTTNPDRKLHVHDGDVIIHSGTGVNTYNDLSIGGINGWSNGEAHRINFVYGANGNNIFQTIEGYYNSANVGESKLRFRNLYNGSANTDISVTILGNGNVGIGDDQPSNKLVVVNSDTDTTPTALLQNSSTGDASLHFNVSGRSYTIGIDNSDDDKFKISRNNGLGTTDRLTIDGDGNVGIGVSPSTRLHVSYPAIGQSGSAVTSITTTQAVDLGVKLSFTGGDNSNGNIIGGIALGNGGEEYAGIYAVDGGSSAATDLALFAGDTNGINEAIRIDSSGKVGIGITNPSYPLDLGTGGSGNHIRARRIWASGTGIDSGFTLDNTLIYQDSGNKFNITIPGSFPNIAFTIDTAGKAGIGTTSPAEKVEIQQNGNYQLKLTNASTGGGNVRIAYADNTFGSGGSKVVFDLDNGGSANAEFVIQSDGKVGVGTVSPNEKLTVVGNISASGIIYGDTFCSNSGSSSTIDFNDNLDVDGYITASNYIATTNTSTTSAMVMGFKDQFKRTYTTEYSFTQSGAGLHTFNLGFPADPNGTGWKYKAVLIIQRQGSAYTFGSIEDNSYIYRETDNDFTHRSEDQVLVSSGLGTSNSVVLSGDITSFNTDVLTSSSTTGSSTYDYYVVRYPLDFNYNFSGTNKIMVHLETYNYSGPDPVFTIA